MLSEQECDSVLVSFAWCSHEHRSAFGLGLVDIVNSVGAQQLTDNPIVSCSTLLPCSSKLLISMPLLRSSSSTISSWPFLDACIRAVQPLLSAKLISISWHWSSRRMIPNCPLSHARFRAVLPSFPFLLGSMSLDRSNNPTTQLPSLVLQTSKRAVSPCSFSLSVLLLKQTLTFHGSAFAP